MSPAEPGVADSGAARVGAELRAARERLGWSLENVAVTLRIRLPYLRAIEEGRVADLPGSAYALGFLRTYAGLLGLDPDEMARRFRAEAEVAGRRTKLRFPAPVPQRGVPPGAVVLLGAVIAIGAYVGWYRMSGDRPGAEPVPAVPGRLAQLAEPAPSAMLPPAQAAQVAAAPPRVAPAAGQPAPPLPVVGGPTGNAGSPSGTGASQNANAPAIPGNPAPPVAQQPLAQQLVLRARADSWVQVRSKSGQVVFNRVLRAGESWPVPQPRPGQPPLLLTTGNAGGTELVVDGVAAPPLGPTGVVKRDVVLDPDLIRQSRPPPAARPHSPGR